MNIAFYLVLKSKQRPAHNHTVIKRLLFVIKIFVYFEWPFYTGFTVFILCFICSYCMNIAFYLVLKSKQMPAHNHPVIKRLLQYRNVSHHVTSEGAQWLSGRVLDSRPKGRGSSLTGVTVFWSLRKTHLS